MLGSWLGRVFQRLAKYTPCKVFASFANCLLVPLGGGSRSEGGTSVPLVPRSPRSPRAPPPCCVLSSMLIRPHVSFMFGKAFVCYLALLVSVFLSAISVFPHSFSCLFLVYIVVNPCFFLFFSIFSRQVLGKPKPMRALAPRKGFPGNDDQQHLLFLVWSVVCCCFWPLSCWESAVVRGDGTSLLSLFLRNSLFAEHLLDQRLFLLKVCSLNLSSGHRCPHFFHPLCPFPDAALVAYSWQLLLTAELFCLQLCLGVLFAYNLSCFTYSFSFFCLQLSFFAYSGKVRLRSTSTDYEQKSFTLPSTDTAQG